MKSGKYLCPACDGETKWHCTQTNRGGVSDGRLRMHDVSTVFVLSCCVCSGDLRTLTGDEVARWVTAQMEPTKEAL